MNCRQYRSCSGRELLKAAGESNRHVILRETMGKRKRNEEDDESNGRTRKLSSLRYLKCGASAVQFNRLHLSGQAGASRFAFPATPE